MKSLNRNFHGDWTLTNKDTGYLQNVNPRPSEPSTTGIDQIAFPKEFIDVQPDTDIRFRGLFASHRCRGALKLEVFDRNHTLIDEISQPIDLSRMGGKRKEDYQEIEVSLRLATNAHFVKPVIVKYDTEQDHPDSFLFFADLYLYRGTKPFHQKRFIDRRLLTEGVLQAGTIMTHTATVDLGEHDFDNWDRVKLEFYANALLIGEKEFIKPVIDILLTSIETQNNQIHGKIGFVGEADTEIALYNLVIGDDQAENPAIQFTSSRALSFHAVPPISLLDNGLHIISIVYGPFEILSIVEFFTAQLTPFTALQKYATAPLPTHLSPVAGFRYRNLQLLIKKKSHRSEYRG
jgi:hypothetical protein